MQWLGGFGDREHLRVGEFLEQRVREPVEDVSGAPADDVDVCAVVDELVVAAIDHLRDFGEVVAVSSFYETEPVEFVAQPWFLNCVAAIATDLTPRELLAALLRSRKRPVVTGGEALIGASGETVWWQGHEGRVRVEGAAEAIPTRSKPSSRARDLILAALARIVTISYCLFPISHWNMQKAAFK